jgi:serine/threonine protein kinase
MGLYLSGQILYESSSSTIETVSRVKVRKIVHKLDQFLLEKKILTNLQYHPNIQIPISIFDNAFLFPRAECDLHDAYKYHKMTSLSDWLPQFIEGINFLFNSSIEHYDIKPENILLFPSSSSDGWNVKIADFGLSRIGAHHYYYGCGTTGYMAPEINSLINLDTPYIRHSMDVYSTACMLFYLTDSSSIFPSQMMTMDWYVQMSTNSHIAISKGLIIQPSKRPCLLDFLRILQSDLLLHPLPDQTPSHVLSCTTDHRPEYPEDYNEIYNNGRFQYPFSEGVGYSPSLSALPPHSLLHHQK